jgi:hypothetical protein
MGYWLSTLPDASSAAPGSHVITVQPDGSDPGSAAVAQSKRGPAGRPSQTVQVKGQIPGEGDLVLTVGPAVANVVASESAWQGLAEPILLAVCQYWRFCVLEAEIDRFTELACADLDHAAMAGLSTLRQHRRLTATARDLRKLLLDMPHFEGPLTSALGYCSSTRAADAYQSVALKLGLEDWCALIDERTEVVQTTYEAVTEKLLELRHFAWTAILESLIIVILLSDLLFGLGSVFLR